MKKMFLHSLKQQSLMQSTKSSAVILNLPKKNLTIKSKVELPSKQTQISYFSKIRLNTNKSQNSLLTLSKRTFSKVNYTYDTRDFLSKTGDYESQIDDLNTNYSYSDAALPGFATSEATEKYSQRNNQEIHKDHFRTLYNEPLKVSSMGLGTYIGAPDDINDFYIYNAVKTCVLSGAVNVIDTAINYRYMKSEKAIGKALNALALKYGIDRRELLICSKIGYVPEDADGGRRAHSFVQELVEDNKMEIEDVIFDEKNRPVHCMHPEFLAQQLALSLRNLGLETLDVLYLHNVVESQGAVLTPELFEKRLTKAFEFLEKARADNKIRNFGLATWECFRTRQSNTGLHCNLQDIVKLAETVGGKNHGFRFIQVPINIMHPEAFVESYQNFQQPEKGVIPATLTSVCSSLKINLISSSPLLQGYMLNLPLENNLFNVKLNSSKHIQLIRSIPADCLKSTLIGMKQQAHIKSNLEVASKPSLSSQQFYDILAPKKRQPFVEKELENK